MNWYIENLRDNQLELYNAIEKIIDEQFEKLSISNMSLRITMAKPKDAIELSEESIILCDTPYSYLIDTMIIEHISY